MITIFIPTPLRRFAADQPQVKLEAGTVADAIRSLTEKFPDLVPYIYDEQASIRKHVRIYLGEDDIRERNGLDTTLRQGDEISILPAIAGGML